MDNFGNGYSKFKNGWPVRAANNPVKFNFRIIKTTVHYCAGDGWKIILQNAGRNFSFPFSNHGLNLAGVESIHC